MPVFAQQSRLQLRRAYLEAWRKHCERRPLEPLEAAIAEVIGQHPEYVSWLERGEEALSAEFAHDTGGENPFLHMGLHLAVREQVATDRPSGIARVFRDLAHQTGDPHAAEHTMMRCLAETLAEAQRHAGTADEEAYRDRLESLVRGGRRTR